MAERVFMKGTEAIAEAAVRAGCRFFAGYPITPQNEIPEYMARRLPEVGGTFVQGESEVVDRWNEYMKDILIMDTDPETGAQPHLECVFSFN